MKTAENCAVIGQHAFKEMLSMMYDNVVTEMTNRSVNFTFFSKKITKKSRA